MIWLARALYASTKPAAAVLIAVVSRATARLAGVAVVFLSVSVTPWMASLTVLDALVIAMPFTVRLGILGGQRLGQVLRTGGVIAQQAV